MSEAAAEAPKKKKSPLPVVVALVAVLGGGGFFMTQSKGSAKEEKSPVIKLAHEEIELEEYLVNMGDRNTYLRTKIAIKTSEDFDGHGMEANMGAVDDAVIRVLRTTKPEEVVTDEDMLKLKRKLAAAMNRVLGHGHEEGGHGAGKVTEIRRKVEEEELPEDWASNEGPVLQVFFKSFAIQ